MTYPIIVLNEPHASIEGLYDRQLSFWDIDARFINEVVFRLTDWHTDFLFHGFRDERIHPVRFPYSRFVVDAERLWNDPLEKVGQGILYRRFGDYHRHIPKFEKNFVVMDNKRTKHLQFPVVFPFFHFSLQPFDRVYAVAAGVLVNDVGKF